MLNIKSLILARGGSKGIPQKNIILLNNKPLLTYLIDVSKLSNANDVWVSTDCNLISKVSIDYGARVIIRPSEISTDKSKSEEALLHFANNIDFDILVFIQPTSPLLLPEDINKGLSMMLDYDSVFSAYKEHWMPRWTLDNKPDGWNINIRPMRQDKPEKYVENGAFYITTKKALIESRCRYSGRIGVVEMPLWRSFQIDTLQDLELIEKLL
jgi:CMP-N-acetylneuraminic acid synthetase